MADATFADVIAQNIRAARARRHLDQGDVVERMRALGYTNWHRPTMGRVERGERRLFAEELLPLASALETSLAALLEPATDENRVRFPSGDAIEAASVTRSVRRGINDGSVEWNENALARIGSPAPTPGVHPAFDPHLAR